MPQRKKIPVTRRNGQQMAGGEDGFVGGGPSLGAGCGGDLHGATVSHGGAWVCGGCASLFGKTLQEAFTLAKA